MTDKSMASDFLAALERLRKGAPLRPQLVGKKPSVWSVALEAGHSRNNLYLPEYAEILDAIRTSKVRGTRKQTPKKTPDERVENLKNELGKVRKAALDVASENVMLRHRLSQAERRIERLTQKLRDNVTRLGER